MAKYDEYHNGNVVWTQQGPCVPMNMRSKTHKKVVFWMVMGMLGNVVMAATILVGAYVLYMHF